MNQGFLKLLLYIAAFIALFLIMEVPIYEAVNQFGGDEIKNLVLASFLNFYLTLLILLFIDHHLKRKNQNRFSKADILDSE